MRLGKVKHTIAVIKWILGFQKVRYRGQATTAEHAGGVSVKDGRPGFQRRLRCTLPRKRTSETDVAETMSVFRSRAPSSRPEIQTFLGKPVAPS